MREEQLRERLEKKIQSGDYFGITINTPCDMDGYLKP